MPIKKKDGFVVVNNFPISCRKISAQTSNWIKKIVKSCSMMTQTKILKHKYLNWNEHWIRIGNLKKKKPGQHMISPLKKDS